MKLERGMGYGKFLSAIWNIIVNCRYFITNQGHTIVGDGTTSQLTGILIGDLEANLPEARLNFPRSGSVNRWPFIFEDYNQKGYAILFFFCEYCIKYISNNVQHSST